MAKRMFCMGFPPRPVAAQSDVDIFYDHLDNLFLVGRTDEGFGKHLTMG